MYSCRPFLLGTHHLHARKVLKQSCLAASPHTEYVCSLTSRYTDVRTRRTALGYFAVDHRHRPYRPILTRSDKPLLICSISSAHMYSKTQASCTSISARRPPL